jgi:DNA-binding CsgD family transcriptional regulator
MGAEPQHRRAVEQLRAWIEAGRPLAQRQGSALTERELQIARLLAQGMTNVEIARTISLSPRAVEFHIYRLLKKIS